MGRVKASASTAFYMNYGKYKRRTIFCMVLKGSKKTCTIIIRKAKLSWLRYSLSFKITWSTMFTMLVSL